MARPVKRGIDYFPLDIDIFSDPKVIPVSAEFGIKGEIIVIHLLCEIYRNGFFLDWNDANKYKLARDMPGVSNSLLDSVVNSLVRWRFFDTDMFRENNVLTSAAIQHRYVNAARRRSRTFLAESPYRLIPLDHPNSKPQTPTTEAWPRHPSDSEYLDIFFGPNNRENLALLAKNMSLPADDLSPLRDLAEAVVAEWQLADVTHPDYSDWSRHIISTMRIKARSRKSSPPPATPPAPADYSFSGGFGGLDT